MDKEIIERAVLSYDPAVYHDRSGLVLIQKKNLVEYGEFGETELIKRCWYEVTHIEILKGDYIQQVDAVIQRWIYFNRFYSSRQIPLTLLIDAAGVGVSVKMTLRNRAELVGVCPVVKPYSFVASLMPVSHSHNTLRLDKPSVYEFAYRIAASGQLKIDTKIPLSKELRIELQNLQVVTSSSGRPLINAPNGGFDDLVTCVVSGLAFFDLRGGVHAVRSIF